MKKEVSPGTMIAVIAVVVLVVGFVAYKTFFQNPNVSPNSAEAMKQYQEIHQKQAESYQKMVGGGAGRGAYRAGNNNQSQTPAPSGN